MISVLMSVYNESLQWVSEAVDSVLNQTYQEFEFIIIIDNPVLPNDILEYFNYISQNDNRIHLLFNQNNIGLAASLNRGLEIAKGEYIARMDADDVSIPERFEKELGFISETNSDVISANKICIDENGNVTGYDAPMTHNPELLLNICNCLNHPSVLMKTASVRACGGYRLMRNSEDYDLWLRMLENGCKISFLNEYLIKYRVRTTSASVGRQLEQHYITQYILKCRRQRIKNGKDVFSPEDLSKYLSSKKISEAKKKSFALSSGYCSEAKRYIKERHFIRGFLSFFKCFIYYPSYAVSRIVIQVKKRGVQRSN